MRTNLLFNSILTILVFIISIMPVCGQQRIVKNAILDKEVLYKDHANNIPTDQESRQFDFSTKFKTFENSQKTTDTLNFPLPGEYSLYFSGEGYVSGNNDYGDKAKANFFENSMDLAIVGVLMEFAWATGSGEDIEIAVWDMDGTGHPGSKLTSEMIPLENIVNDVMNSQMTYIPFNIPPTVGSSFFVGAILPTMAGDTIALWTNTDGDTDPATAWEQWDVGTWYAYDNPDSWAMKVSHAIFPIVSGEVTLTAAFGADNTQVQLGSQVQFNDQSIGGATSWMWEFEGGEPATSTAQNPTVTYNQMGTFDVKLKVSDGTTSDSLTKQNYIVVSEQVQNIDTLNFPLAGSYVIFTVNDGGGYVCGNNAYGDLAKANHFANTQEGNITGMLVKFVWAVGGNPDIEVDIWDNNGGTPETKLGSTSISMSNIKNDVNNQQVTYIPFNNPVAVSGSFFAGFILPTATGDTLVVWSNDDGDTNPGIAWEMWNDNSWHAFNGNDSWGINCALAIHPIIDYAMDIPEFENESGFITYPNPSIGIFNIEVKEQNQRVSLDVFDTRGCIVKSISNFVAQEDVAIDIQDNENGIYFIRLKTQDGYIWSKVVKQ